MATELTADEIERARALRLDGKGFQEIKELLGTDVEASSIRQHCSDIVPEGGGRSYERKAGVVEAVNRTIRPFTDEEDAQLIAWNNAPAADRGTLNVVAKVMDRKRHSALARLKTLKRRGKIDALML